MNKQNQKNPLKKLVSLIGIASAGTLVAVPALVIIDSSPTNPSRRLLAQIVPGTTQQNSTGTGTTQQPLGNPIPQPQVPPLGAGTTQQPLGNPIPQPQVPPLGAGTTQQPLGNPIPQPQTFPTGTGTFQPGIPIPQIPGTGTTQPNTQRSGF